MFAEPPSETRNKGRCRFRDELLNSCEGLLMAC